MTALNEEALEAGKTPRTAVGSRYGRLVVTARAEPLAGVKGRIAMWTCRCDCGRDKDVRQHNLVGGGTTSCGHCHKERTAKHGLARTGKKHRLYEVWQTMVARCENRANPSFKNYGGRGITVCDRWRTGDAAFSGPEYFIADMGERPFADASIDRIDNDSPYSPENCRWATKAEQMRNSRRAKLTAVDVAEIRALFGPGVTDASLAAQYGVAEGTILGIRRGKSWKGVDAAAMFDAAPRSRKDAT